MIFPFIAIFIIGLVVGSFLNVIICRLPEKKSIAKGRSCCPSCQERIKFYDLIPIVSFFILKRKCRKCKKPISWQYPLVELFTGLIFVFLAYHYQIVSSLSNPLFFRDLVFVCALIVIFTTDLRFFMILDMVVIPMMVFALLVNIFILSNSANFISVIISLIVSAIVAGGFFWLQYVISKGKWIGMGDVNLGFLMGFMLGWPNILFALVLGYFLGAIVSVILLLFKLKKMDSPLPFGVFLTVATGVAMLWGSQIIGWYLGLLK